MIQLDKYDCQLDKYNQLHHPIKYIRIAIMNNAGQQFM